MTQPVTRSTSGDAHRIDLTDEVEGLRRRLATAEAAFVAIVERSSDGILVVDRQGVAHFANAAALELLGRSRTDLVGADIGFAVLVDDVAEVELVRPGGEVVVAEMRVVDTVWEGQSCLLALLRDVTERHQAQAQLAERATHDHLTGLPNRFLLEDRLAHALDRLSRVDDSLVLLLGDLDDFKSVNDRWGHAAGDAVLVEAARRIRSVLRPVDTVARFGGDEFVMLCESTDQTEARELVRRLGLAFREPFVVAGDRVTLGLSVGFVLAAQRGTSARALLAAADEQMFEHKRRSRAAAARAAHPPAATAAAPTSAGDETGTQYRFVLHVAGDADASATAAQDVDRFCQQYLPAGSCSVEVVDVLRAVDRADSARVLVTPALTRYAPLPVVRAVGDLSDPHALAAVFGLGRPGA